MSFFIVLGLMNRFNVLKQKVDEITLETFFIH